MNPLAILPAKVRLAVYAVVFVVGLALAAWQAAEGDWVAFGVLITGSLTGALAGSNVKTATATAPETETEYDGAQIVAALKKHNRRLGK